MPLYPELIISFLKLALDHFDLPSELIHPSSRLLDRCSLLGGKAANPLLSRSGLVSAIESEMVLTPVVAFDLLELLSEDGELFTEVFASHTECGVLHACVSTRRCDGELIFSASHGAGRVTAGWILHDEFAVSVAKTVAECLSEKAK